MCIHYLKGHPKESNTVLYFENWRLSKD
jgi:hypothetical protein